MNTTTNMITTTTTTTNERVKHILQTAGMGAAAIVNLLFLGQMGFATMLLIYAFVFNRTANNPALNKPVTAMNIATVLLTMGGLAMSYAALPYVAIVNALAIVAALVTFEMKRV